MLKHITVLLLALAFLALSNSVLASNSLDLSTGVNVGLPGNPLYSFDSPNNRDNYWITRTIPPNNMLINQPSWTRFYSSYWNIIPGTLPIFGNTDDVGTTEYERCFCMSQLTGATLDIVFRADNYATLYLNQYSGNPILITPTNDSFNRARPPISFQYNAQNGLKLGKNCMRMRVYNQHGPTGFALKATLNAIGAQDTYQENGCCQQGSPVFSLPPSINAPGDDDIKPSEQN